MLERELLQRRQVRRSMEIKLKIVEKEPCPPDEK